MKQLVCYFNDIQGVLTSNDDEVVIFPPCVQLTYNCVTPIIVIHITIRIRDMSNIKSYTFKERFKHVLSSTIIMLFLWR